MYKNILLISFLCSFALLSGCTSSAQNNSEEVTQMLVDDERSADLQFMLETYGFREEELEGIDLSRFIADFELRSREYSAEEVRDILNAQKTMYIDDGSTALYSIFSKDGRELREDDDVNQMGLYLNQGTSLQQFIFDLENNVYYVDTVEPIPLSSQQSVQLKELLREYKIYSWERHTQGEEERSTGSFGWKLVVRTVGGEYCTYDGYTQDGTHLPDSFTDFLNGIQRVLGQDK